MSFPHPTDDHPAIVLASGSQVRARIMRDAGLTFEIIPANVDEVTIQSSMEAEGAPPAHVAETLAEMKAMRVSQNLLAKGVEGAFVIGADQVLDLNGTRFDKPTDRDHAAAHLKTLSGKTHQLISATVIAKNGAAIWRHIGKAKLTVRPLNDEQIAAYLDQVGDLALASVGAYQIEGLGIHLFSAMEGDQTTIQGLPILPLLDFLRANQIVM